VREKPETDRPPETPFERFERFVRKVVTTPKPDQQKKPPKVRKLLA